MFTGAPLCLNVSFSFRQSWSLIACMLGSLMSVSMLAATEFEIEFKPRDFESPNAIASFECPPSIWNPELLSRDISVPVQLGLDGLLYVQMDDLESPFERQFRLRNRASDPVSRLRVWVEHHGGEFTFQDNAGPLIRYQGAPSELPRDGIDPVFRRGGYLHPLWTPSGRIVSDDYPENHLHHHGVWVSWTKTEFDSRQPNFWEMGNRKGTVEFVAVDHYWGGAVFGGLRARHRYVDLTLSESVVVLSETWNVKVYASPSGQKAFHLVDLHFVQQCATDKPVKFPKYRYGGLGFRGRGEWDGAKNASFMTASGETDRIKGHATRAAWCSIGGMIDRQKVGLAILCHPSNFRAPQPMRLHPSEPFFCYAPAQLGDWAIKPGMPYESRYRFVIFDGEPNPELLNQIWQDYAHPIEVTVKPIVAFKTDK